MTTKRERLEEPLAYLSSRRPTHSLSNNSPLMTTTFKRPNSLTTTARFLFFGFTLLSLILSTAQVSVDTQQNSLRKRFAQSPLCPQLGNGQLYCMPTSGQAFNSTDYITFAWNTQDNTFAVQGYLDIYIYRSEGIKQVYYKPNVPNANTSISVLPSDSWFDPYVPNGNNNNTYNFYFIATAPNAGPTFTNTGPVFSIRYFPPPSTKPPVTTTTQEIISQETATITTGMSSSPGASSSNSGNSKPLTPALIAVIACASLAVLAAIGAVLYAVNSRKRNKKHHQSLSNLSTTSHTPIVQITPDTKDLSSKLEPEDASSIHSTTPLASKNSVSSLTQKLSLPSNSIGVTTTTTTFSTVGQTSPTITFTGSDKSSTSTPAFDAAFLSDAYRKVLRKPDWKGEDDDDDDEFYTDDGLSQEEQRRRREAKELMKKELAEEGRGLHSVSRRHTKVQMRKIDDEDEDSTSRGDGGSNSDSHGIL